jgi:EmrB/QacA subfamily drug resistance transporter
MSSPPRVKGRGVILALVCAAQFMVILDFAVVNVALPSMQADLHVDQSDLQWVIITYGLTFGGFLLLGGRAGDLLGRQRLFIAGLVLFTGASLVNGFATSSEMLIVGRAVQGLGAALVSPAVLSIMVTTFAEGRERARALAVFAAIATGGGATGLILGGVLTDVLSWRWVFYINLPVGILAVLAALRWVPNSRAETRPETSDVAGAVTVTGGLLLLVYDIVKASQYGWTSGRTLGLAAGAIALLAAFVVIELRSRAPLVDLSIFRKRSLTVSNTAMMLFAAGLFGTFYFTTLYLQDIHGDSPLRTGVSLLPFPIMIAFASVLAQLLLRRLGVRPILFTGLAVAAAGLFWLSGLPASSSYLSDVFPAIAVMGFGIGFTFSPLILIATTGVADDEAGLASGLVNTSQQVGGALGLAILASLAASQTNGALAAGVGQAQSLVDGYTRAYMVAGGFAIAALVLVAALIRSADVAMIEEQVDVPESVPDEAPLYEAA